MSVDVKDSESVQRVAGWRKGLFWLLGAGALAVVGYRGALGSHMVSLPVALPVASAAEHRAPSLLPAAGKTAGEMESARPTGPVQVPAPRSSSLIASDAVPAAETVGGAAPGTAATSAAMVSPPALEPTGSPDGAIPSGITADGKVILNLASEAELRRLPGIGKTRAHAIVELRQRAGRFRRVEELLRVKGIGPKKLAALRPKVVLDAP